MAALVRYLTRNNRIIIYAMSDPLLPNICYKHASMRSRDVCQFLSSPQISSLYWFDTSWLRFLDASILSRHDLPNTAVMYVNSVARTNSTAEIVENHPTPILLIAGRTTADAKAPKKYRIQKFPATNCKRSVMGSKCLTYQRLQRFSFDWHLNNKH